MSDLTNISIVDRLKGQWKRRKWLFMVCFLAVFTVTVSLVMALPSLYRSSTTIALSHDDIAESLVKPGVANELELRLGVIQQAVLSRTQLQQVIDKFDLYSALRKSAPPETAIGRLREDITIEQQASDKPEWEENSTFAITIGYQGWNPATTALVANDLAARFKAENEKIRQGQVARASGFANEQLETARQKFLAQESRIDAFKNEHMGELPEQEPFNMATLDRLNDELRLNGERQVQLLDRRDELLFGASGASPVSGATGLTGNLRLERLKRDLAELHPRYTANHPDIIRLNREIETLTLELASTDAITAESDTFVRQGQNPADVDKELVALRQGDRELRTAIAGVTSKIKGTPRLDQQLQQFNYDYESAKSEYLSLQRLNQDALLMESLESEGNQQFQVVEAAIAPDFPFAPNRPRLIFIGFLLALGIAAAALLAAEQLDTSFHTAADINRFTVIPVLARTARIQTSADKWRELTRFSLASVVVIAGLFTLAGTSYYAGTHAEQLVLAIST